VFQDQCTQESSPLWIATIGDHPAADYFATIADTVLDRILENAHRIELSGESIRRTSSTESEAP